MNLKQILEHTIREAEDHIQYVETEDERAHLLTVIGACRRELRLLS